MDSLNQVKIKYDEINAYIKHEVHGNNDKRWLIFNVESNFYPNQSSFLDSLKNQIPNKSPI